jgi:hypothetical protein
MSTPIMPLRQALEDPHLFGFMFDDPSWFDWKVVLIGMNGEFRDQLRAPVALAIFTGLWPTPRF